MMTGGQRGWRTVLGITLAACVGLSLERTSKAQITSPEIATSKADESVIGVARRLASDGRITKIPSKHGTLDRDIRKGEPVFDLPDGQSPAVLFEFPASAASYQIQVKSETIGKMIFTLHMFVPEAAVLDQQMHVVRRLAEADFSDQNNK